MTREQKRSLLLIAAAAVLLIGLHFVPVTGWLKLVLYLIPYLLVGGEDSECDGEVVGRALLLDVGGSHVDYHFFAGEIESALLYGRHDALGALLDGGVGQSDHDILESGVGDNFDSDGYGVDALQGGTVGFDEHGL